jgi:hypothetical protein
MPPGTADSSAPPPPPHVRPVYVWSPQSSRVDVGSPAHGECLVFDCACPRTLSAPPPAAVEASSGVGGGSKARNSRSRLRYKKRAEPRALKLGILRGGGGSLRSAGGQGVDQRQDRQRKDAGERMPPKEAMPMPVLSAIGSMPRCHRPFHLRHVQTNRRSCAWRRL